MRPAVAPDTRLDAAERHAPRTSLALRLRVWARSAALDARLAEGANPLGDEALALRARQLVEPATRHRLAFAVESVVRAAHAPVTLERARQAARLNAEAVRAASDDLCALATRLRDARPVSEHGVAMTSVLLRDGCGPLYDADAPLPLSYCVRMALLCLDPLGAAVPQRR
jgi:hypothetical protein